MPTDEGILGFSNRWYAAALKNANRVTLPSGVEIQEVSAPYFIAIKLEAFAGRGQGDYLGSHDMEDIIAVVDGREELLDEITSNEAELQQYLVDRIATLMGTRDFRDALPGHMPSDLASQQHLPLLVARLNAIAGLAVVREL